MYVAKNTFTVKGKQFRRWKVYSESEIPEGWEGYFQPAQGFKPSEIRETAENKTRSKRKK